MSANKDTASEGSGAPAGGASGSSRPRLVQLNSSSSSTPASAILGNGSSGGGGAGVHATPGGAAKHRYGRRTSASGAGKRRTSAQAVPFVPPPVVLPSSPSREESVSSANAAPARSAAPSSHMSAVFDRGTRDRGEGRGKGVETKAGTRDAAPSGSAEGAGGGGLGGGGRGGGQRRAPGRSSARTWRSGSGAQSCVYSYRFMRKMQNCAMAQQCPEDLDRAFRRGVDGNLAEQKKEQDRARMARRQGREKGEREGGAWKGREAAPPGIQAGKERGKSWREQKAEEGGPRKKKKDNPWDDVPSGDGDLSEFSFGGESDPYQEWRKQQEREKEKKEDPVPREEAPKEQDAAVGTPPLASKEPVKHETDLWNALAGRAGGANDGEEDEDDVYMHSVLTSLSLNFAVDGQEDDGEGEEDDSEVGEGSRFGRWFRTGNDGTSQDRAYSSDSVLAAGTASAPGGGEPSYQSMSALPAATSGQTSRPISKEALFGGGGSGPPPMTILPKGALFAQGGGASPMPDVSGLAAMTADELERAMVGDAQVPGDGSEQGGSGVNIGEGDGKRTRAQPHSQRSRQGEEESDESGVKEGGQTATGGPAGSNDSAIVGETAPQDSGDDLLRQLVQGESKNPENAGASTTKSPPAEGTAFSFEDFAKLVVMQQTEQQQPDKRAPAVGDVSPPDGNASMPLQVGGGAAQGPGGVGRVSGGVSPRSQEQLAGSILRGGNEPYSGDRGVAPGAPGGSGQYPHQQYPGRYTPHMMPGGRSQSGGRGTGQVQILQRPPGGMPGMGGMGGGVAAGGSGVPMGGPGGMHGQYPYPNMPMRGGMYGGHLPGQPMGQPMHMGGGQPPMPRMSGGGQLPMPGMGVGGQPPMPGMSAGGQLPMPGMGTGGGGGMGGLEKWFGSGVASSTASGGRPLPQSNVSSVDDIEKQFQGQ